MALPAGVIVLIVFLCLFAVYFLVGTIVRFRSGLHHCPEVLPNYRFWSRLVALIVAAFTCGRVRLGGPRGGRDAEYDGFGDLPSRPRTGAGRRVHFETYNVEGDEDLDEEFYAGTTKGMKPADVVVRR